MAGRSLQDFLLNERAGKSFIAVKDIDTMKALNGKIEYVINLADGRIFYYDINGQDVVDRVFIVPDNGVGAYVMVNEDVDLSGFIPTSEKGARNGVAPLDSSGEVPFSNIPHTYKSAVEFVGYRTDNVTLAYTHGKPPGLNSTWYYQKLRNRVEGGYQYYPVRITPNINSGDPVDYDELFMFHLDNGEWYILTHDSYTNGKYAQVLYIKLSYITLITLSS
jgi:hypothetical protein